MFDFIKGKLAASCLSSVVIETQGIGYRIFIPASVFGKLPQRGEGIELFTSFVVRELSHTLYGFLTAEDRDFFDVLMGITGVGPKLALNLLGAFSESELKSFIHSGNTDSLCKIPGVGKKTAERLLLELRDKVKSSPKEKDVLAPQDPKACLGADALSALIHLGYHQNVAEKAIKKTLEETKEDEADLSALITRALKNIR